MSRALISSFFLCFGAVMTITTSSAILLQPPPPEETIRQVAARVALAIARQEITPAPSTEPQLIVPMASWNAPTDSQITAQTAGILRSGPHQLRRYRVNVCLSGTCAASLSLAPTTLNSSAPFLPSAQRNQP